MGREAWKIIRGRLRPPVAAEKALRLSSDYSSFSGISDFGFYGVLLPAEILYRGHIATSGLKG